MTFLGLNGADFVADEAGVAAANLGPAAGEVDESGLAHWIRDNRPAG